MDRISELVEKAKRLYNPQYMAYLKERHDSEVVYSEDIGKEETRRQRRRRKGRAWSAAYRARHPEIVRARELLGRELRNARKKSAASGDLAKYLRFLLSHSLCYWCKKQIEDEEDKTIDHVIPFSKGGTNSPENLVLSCRDCNHAKTNKNIYAWIEEVLREPGESTERASGNAGERGV